MSLTNQVNSCKLPYYYGSRKKSGTRHPYIRDIAKVVLLGAMVTAAQPSGAASAAETAPYCTPGMTIKSGANGQYVSAELAYPDG